MFERAMGPKPQRRSAPTAFSTLPNPFASDLADTRPAQPIDTVMPQQSGVAFDIGSISINPPESQIGPEGGNLPPSLGERIGARQGGGAPLNPSMKQTMEAGFGQNFADVHVHTDGEADALNQNLSASAFTLGSDIFLGREAASTRPHGGDALMAHELTHVVQQRGAWRGEPMTVDPVDAPGEREASAIAREVSTGTAPTAQTQPATANHATVQREVSAPDAPAAQSAPATPADIAAQSGFNPMDINHKLLRSIDQSHVKIVGSVSHAYGLYSDPIFKRHVDFDDTVTALNHLTAAQIQAVREAYQTHENRSLDTDLFGLGESGYVTDLTEDQLAQLRALLGGTTVAEGASKEEQGAAETNAASAKAAELHRLLKGDLGHDDIERVMNLLRQNAAANVALIAAYGHLGGDLRTDTMGMGILEGQRAWKLLDGNIVGADAFKVDLERARISGIDERVVAIVNEMKEDPYSAISAASELKDLDKERKKLVEDIEQRAEQAGADARAETKGDAHAAVQARVAAVLGDAGSLATTVGGADAAVIRAAANDDPVQKTAAQMHKAAQDDKLSAEMITASLRGLRTEAQQRAEHSLPPNDPRVAETASHLADDYFTRLSTAYNNLVTGDEKKWNEIVDDTGNEGDQSVNIALMQQHGKLSDIAELIFALKDDRKDMAAVQNVLRDKSAAQIRELSDAFKTRTGKDLKYELFGNASTQGGEDQAIYDMYSGTTRKIDTGEELVKGKASGTDRLNLEDFMQRPDTEGGPQEVTYIMERAEREYQYTLDHGGITGGIRDAFGNEERDLLDESIKEVRSLFGQYAALIGWIPMFDPDAAKVARPEMAHSGEAHGLLEKMRLARATIRGDRAAYEKATAQLRAMFEMVAAFVLQAVISALLTPAAGALLEAVELGADAVEAGVMAARIAKFAASTTVNVVSTVGANLAVYGDDYSVAMLKSDLLGGLGGSLGGEAIDKMLGPVAKGMAERLGSKASKEIIALAKTAGSIEGGAWAQGSAGDLSIQNIVKTHLMGKAAGAITEATGKATGLAPDPGPQKAAAPDEQAAPQATEPAPQESHTGTTATDESRRTPPASTGQETAVGGGAGSRATTTPERLPSGAHEEEPGQTLSPAATEPTTTDEGRPGARSPGSDEEQTLVDWEPDVVHELPAGSAIMFDTPAEGRKLYSQSIREDSQREVAIYRNTRTGEVVVGQGSAGEVALDLQVMHESLPGPPGTWELEAHYHPINEQTGVTPPAQRLPSSTNGDFSVLEWESQRSGNQRRTSRIDIITEGDRRNYTEFSYDPTAERPYKIDYPHPETGERTEVDFKSREAYEEWYSNEFDGARADIEPQASATTAGGTAPAASSPGADEGGSGGSRGEEPGRTTTSEGEQSPGDFDSFDEAPTGVDLLPVGEDPTQEEIRRLVQGEGLSPLPTSPEEMEHSNAEVDLATQILQDPKASPESVREAIRTLIDRAVAEYRAAHLEGGMTSPPNPRALTAEKLRGCCSTGRDVSAEAILALVGNSPHEVMIERVQAENLGFGQVHGFNIVTLADGTRFLVDPTFAQFADENNSFFSADQMLSSNEGSALARDLLRDGVVPLTPEAARQYILGLGADPSVVDIDDAAARLLTGDAAIVTEIVRNGKVERIAGYPDQADNMETVSEDDAPVLSSLQEMVPGMSVDNPRRPLLESLMRSLERLQEYLPRLPRPPRSPD